MFSGDGGGRTTSWKTLARYGVPVGRRTISWVRLLVKNTYKRYITLDLEVEDSTLERNASYRASDDLSPRIGVKRTRTYHQLDAFSLIFVQARVCLSTPITHSVHCHVPVDDARHTNSRSLDIDTPDETLLRPTARDNQPPLLSLGTSDRSSSSINHPAGWLLKPSLPVQNFDISNERRA